MKAGIQPKGNAATAAAAAPILLAIRRNHVVRDRQVQQGDAWRVAKGAISLSNWHAKIRDCSRWMRQPRVAMKRLGPIYIGLHELIDSGSVDPGKCIRMLLHLSSMQIDAACDASDVNEIERGMAWPYVPA